MEDKFLEMINSYESLLKENNRCQLNYSKIQESPEKVNRLFEVNTSGNNIRRVTTKKVSTVSELPPDIQKAIETFKKSKGLTSIGQTGDGQLVFKDAYKGSHLLVKNNNNQYITQQYSNTQQVPQITPVLIQNIQENSTQITGQNSNMTTNPSNGWDNNWKPVQWTPNSNTNVDNEMVTRIKNTESHKKKEGKNITFQGLSNNGECIFKDESANKFYNLVYQTSTDGNDKAYELRELDANATPEIKIPAQNIIPEDDVDSVDMSAMNYFTRSDVATLVGVMNPVIKKFNDKLGGDKGNIHIDLGKALKGTYKESLVQTYKRLLEDNEEESTVDVNSLTDEQKKIFDAGRAGGIAYQARQSVKNKDSNKTPQQSLEFQVIVTLKKSQGNDDEKQSKGQDEGKIIKESLSRPEVLSVLNELQLELPDFIQLEEGSFWNGIKDGIKDAANNITGGIFSKNKAANNVLEVSELNEDTLKSIRENFTNFLNQSKIALPLNGNKEATIPVTFSDGDTITPPKENQNTGIFTLKAEKQAQKNDSGFKNYLKSGFEGIQQDTQNRPSGSVTL